jgi:hypothetical protein
MNEAAEILTELQRRGVIVAVERDTTLCLRPRRALDDALLARVREAKPAILEALRNRPATCSPDCYEIEPGIWIHRAHASCTTIKPEASGSQQKVAVTCWHCGDQKKCDCSACWQAGPGNCVTCKGTGQMWRWIQ